MKKLPERMCHVCRKHFPKNELIRICKTPVGEILIDETGKIDGRGVYICKNEECVAKMQKTKSLNRCFKCNVDEEISKSIAILIK